MNLKNSKFLKRIQELQKYSKDKVRRERIAAREEMNKVQIELQNALKERPVVLQINQNNEMDQHGVKKKKNKDKEIQRERDYDVEVRYYNKNKKDDSTDDENDQYSGGLIQLNNTRFRLKCNPQKYRRSKEDITLILANKGSICVTNSRYPMIGRVAKYLGYKLVREAKLWNILWTDSLPGVELYKTMKRFQQINHYPGMMEICRKDLLSRNLNRMLKLFPRDYKIFPRTWMFPADYGDALNYAMNHTRKTRTFIVKPDAGAQGRGIRLTNDLKSINPTERLICQTYITKPLLIDGYKFDLRVYVLITSVDPLRIFVYNEGLVRLATNKYVEPNSENSTDLFMHLTNYSLNKRNSQYDLCDNDDCGSKRNFSAINTWMRRNNIDVEGFWNKIDDIVIKTVLSAWPVLKHHYHACFPSHDKIQGCFEILGFDILVDAKLKPYILEVNHSPSFHTNECVDRQVKRALIRDTLCLVSAAIADKRQIIREDRKRVKQRLLKMRQGDVTQRSNYSSYQMRDGSVTNRNGCSNDVSAKTNEECPLGPLAQQIAWEESHLGDFRRVMPPSDPAKLSYYCQFYALQNQASIYAETASSKKREEVAKKLRLQLEQKRQKQQELLTPGRMRFDERYRKRAGVPRALIEKHRLRRIKVQVNWSPGFISEAEERLRRSWMQMRTDLLKEKKILELVYNLLYSKGNLTNADIINYPELYENLENGIDICEEL